MINVVCRKLALSEVDGLRLVDEYETMVRPLDYEFDLVRGAAYLVLGISTRLGTPWLYVASSDGDKELQLVPALLFSFDWCKVPNNWSVKIGGDGCIRLLPAHLATISNWFEKYINGERVVVDLIETEILRARSAATQGRELGNGVSQQRSLEAVQPHCPSCSASQGGQLGVFSRLMKNWLGF